MSLKKVTTVLCKGSTKFLFLLWRVDSLSWGSRLFLHSNLGCRHPQRYTLILHIPNLPHAAERQHWPYTKVLSNEPAIWEFSQGLRNSETIAALIQPEGGAISPSRMSLWSPLCLFTPTKRCSPQPFILHATSGYRELWETAMLGRTKSDFKRTFIFLRVLFFSNSNPDFKRISANFERNGTGKTLRAVAISECQLSLQNLLQAVFPAAHTDSN